MSNPYGSSILANCDTRLLLKLKDTEMSLVSKHIMLTDDEQSQILSFDRGQALLLAGKNRMAINISASLKDDRDFTTDPNKLRQYALEEAQEEAVKKQARMQNIKKRRQIVKK